MLDLSLYVLFPTAMVIASMYTFFSFAVVHYVYVDTYKHSIHNVSYHDYRGYFDHLVEAQGRELIQSLTNSSMWIFNIWYDSVKQLLIYVTQHRYAIVSIIALSFLAFIISHQGHVILDKFNLFYEDIHDLFLYPIKVGFHALGLLYSAFAGFYTMLIMVMRNVTSFFANLFLKVDTDLLLEGVGAICTIVSEWLRALHKWIVVDGFIEGSPDYLRVCLALQRFMWVCRELLIQPCDMLRHFWESALTPLAYYEPTNTEVRLGEHYFPMADSMSVYEAYNKWCYVQNLTGSVRYDESMREVLEVYTPEFSYCAACDYNNDIRQDCVPHAYNAPLALNAFFVVLCKWVQLPVYYVLRSRAAFDTVASALGIRKIPDVRERGTSDSTMQEYFFTGGRSEMKYSICWNSYVGYDGEHENGFPVEPYLHHAPWLLCPDYASYYRTFDMDGLTTSQLDVLGFGFDALDEWYMEMVNYLQYLIVKQASDKDVKSACGEFWSVHKTFYDEDTNTCTTTPPSAMGFIKHPLQILGGTARICGRFVSYLDIFFQALRSVWEGLLTGQNDNNEDDVTGLVHQMVETPNTIGCLHGENSAYASTSTQESTYSNARYYCAKAYLVDQLEQSLLGVPDLIRSVNLTTEADVVEYAVKVGMGKVRFAYRLSTVVLFGPYQAPPDSPGYPAPPSPPPQPPPPPKCLVPVTKATNDATDATIYGLGLEAWNAYGCGYAQDNPSANVIAHDRKRGSNTTYRFAYINKQWSFTETPSNLTVDCFFVPVYGAYGNESWATSLCPVPENRRGDADADMCVLSGYPSPKDAAHVDTTSLQTVPNVFMFNTENQEDCSCDDQASSPVSEGALYTCPSSKYYAPTVKQGYDTQQATVVSYLVDTDHDAADMDESLGFYTREGKTDYPYPVCRGLQVSLLDTEAGNVSYDFAMSGRCRLASDQYTNGLETEGYGRQVECSLVAVTDISNDTLRQAASFIISDNARVMRLPVRVIRRFINGTSSRGDLTYEKSMLSPTVDLLAQGPSWTARVAEQVFDGSVSDEVSPIWSAYKSVGGFGAGMHQPLCSCDPFEYVAPTLVRNVKHCAPRRFESIPPPPTPPPAPSAPPPPAPSAPSVTNSTVCRSPGGYIMAGYEMRYHAKDISPENCVCRESGMSPVASYSSTVEDTYYCPEECDHSSISGGPTCICRRQDIEFMEIKANGKRSVSVGIEEAKQKLVRVLNEVSSDVASVHAEHVASNETSQNSDFEFAFSFDFESEKARFPTLENISDPDFCSTHLGEGWDLHVERDGNSQSQIETREMLQAVVDERVNDWVMAASGMAFMDGHALCADRYRVALPPRGRRHYTGSLQSGETSPTRSVLNPSRTAWRLAIARNKEDAGMYDQTDVEYVNAALSDALYSASSRNQKTPSDCAVADSLLNNIRNTVIMSMFEKKDGDSKYRLRFDANGTCSVDGEYMIRDRGSAYDLACAIREDDTPVYTAADALNRRFSHSSLDGSHEYSQAEDSAYGFMHHIERKLQRVSLLNQTGYVKTVGRCELPRAFSDYSDVFVSSDENAHVCKMYVDQTYLTSEFQISEHPKRRYSSDAGPFLRRYARSDGYRMCSNSSESDVQSLCHDANLLSAEQMAQAATFCGFSFVAESVRPTHARTVCRSLPYGFVHRCNATEQKTYSWSQRDGTDDAARTDYVYHAIAAPSDPVNTTDMHDADNKMVILNGTILDSAELDDFRTNDRKLDGVSELSERRLREAREAIADFKTHVAKCALNALNTFPFLDSDDSHGFASLYANSRANSLERILSPRLNGSGGTPWPYPWTKRGPLKNMSRVTIGAVLQKGTSGHGYAQLSSVGPVSERVEVEGVGATVGVDAPGRLRHDARGNSQGGHRRDPVLFETDLAFAFARDDSKAFGTSLRSQLSQADPGLHHERYHTNGTFEAAARPAFTNATADDAYEGLDPATRRSSTVYLVEKHDQSFLMRDSSAGHASNATRLYDFGGYLFESDVHLTHGARDDLHDHDDGESVAGDFDSSGNVGTYGLSTRKNEYLPLKDVSATTELDWADEVRTFNRQLFFVVGKSDTPISFCTTGGDDTSDTFSTRHTRPSPHDSKLDSKMCTEMNQRRYSNWASDYPMHGATLGKEATDAILGAGTFDCAAINVLSGSHCALYKDDEGGCLLGHDAKYAQWVTLPCSQRKPFVCGNGELMKAIVTPMGFDEARAHCILEFGSDYDLVSPPSNKIENSDLATTARDALCAAEKLQPYATEGDDICNRYPDVTHAEKHTEQTLAELIDSSCMKRDLLLRKYHCCDTTSAYLYVYAENSTEKTLVRNHVGVAGATHFTCEDPIRPGSHARGSFYANGDTITAGDEASYGDAWNLQYGSVWMGMRRHGRLRRFSDQRIGKCDLRGSDSVAEAMLFEIVPCKDDSDSHVSGEYAIVGRDPTGRSVLLAVHEASHPFDAEALGTEAATRNAEAFIHAVDKNRTLLNPSSIESATDLLSSYETLFENHLEHPLRPSVWRTRATTLKMLESGYRRGVTMDNARSGRCVQSEARPDRQLHGVSIVTCNVEQHCGTIQFDVNAAVKLNFVMIPTDGESTGDLMQTLASDLSLDRPVMHSRWRTSSTRRRLIAQTSDASGLFGWTKSMNETLFTDAYRRNESALSDGGVTKPFATKSTYGTRGAADSALDPGDRMRSKVFGGPHVAAEASDDIFSVGRGVVDMKTYFHTLNVSTYPCEGTHYLDASFPYDAHTCASLVDHLPAPRIKEVYTPSTCGVDSYESDERCTLLSLLTGRRLGFVEGIHARPSSSQPVLLERLDALWDAAEDDEDHELFSESTTAEHLKTIAQRSNRKSLWYPILHDDRDNMEAQRQMTSLDEVHSNGWLYTCAGKTLAFEPAINLGNPPAPNSPPSEFLSSNENTNIGKFQVTAGGVLIQVNITGNARVRRDIAEAYTVSNAQSS
eukprot:gene3359-4221_t